MYDHVAAIKEFMQGARQHTPSYPVVPPEDVRRLRARLILEEAIETVVALGFEPVVDYTIDRTALSGFSSRDIEIDDLGSRIELKSRPDWVDLVEIADGVADVSVVAIGTALACGIDINPILKLVDDNNLAKLGPGHTFDEFGKLKKPPGHPKPDIGKEIMHQIVSA